MTDATTAAPEPDEDTKEGIDYRPDGSVWVWIDGRRYRLRRIRGREFRRLRDTLTDARDLMRDRQAELEAWSDALTDAVMARRAEDPGAMPNAEERREDSKKAREVARESEALMFGWWAECFEVLSKDGTPVLAPPTDDQGEPVNPVPDDFDPFEDLPMWMGTPDSVDAIFAHWRSVPSLSGGR